MTPLGTEGGFHSITTVLPDRDDSLGADKPCGPIKTLQYEKEANLSVGLIIARYSAFELLP